MLLDTSLRNLGWKLSGPGDLFGLRLCNISSKSFSETSHDERVLGMFPS